MVTNQIRGHFRNCCHNTEEAIRENRKKLLTKGTAACFSLKYCTELTRSYSSYSLLYRNNIFVLSNLHSSSTLQPFFFFFFPPKMILLYYSEVLSCSFSFPPQPPHGEHWKTHKNVQSYCVLQLYSCAVYPVGCILRLTSWGECDGFLSICLFQAFTMNLTMKLKNVNLKRPWRWLQSLSVARKQKIVSKANFDGYLTDFRITES